MNLDDKQAALQDALDAARMLVSALENAESCETETDYAANVADACEHAKSLRRELKDITENVS